MLFGNIESVRTSMGRSQSMELELSLLERALALIETNLEKTLDGIRDWATLIERVSFIAYAIGPRAQHTVQPQATSIDELTNEVWHERRFGRHLVEIVSVRNDQNIFNDGDDDEQGDGDDDDNSD